VSDYSEIFGQEAESWRAPLGALRLTLADESAPAWQLERARAECEELVKVLNAVPQFEQVRYVAPGSIRCPEREGGGQRCRFIDNHEGDHEAENDPRRTGKGAVRRFVTDWAEVTE